MMLNKFHNNISSMNNGIKGKNYLMARFSKLSGLHFGKMNLYLQFVMKRLITIPFFAVYLRRTPE